MQKNIIKARLTRQPLCVLLYMYCGAFICRIYGLFFDITSGGPPCQASTLETLSNAH